MKSYDSSKPLISFHVSKTAGTSLRHLLQAWFPGDCLLLHYRTEAELSPRYELKGPVCIHGLFNAARGVGVDDYYPAADQFMAVLR